MTKKEIKYEVLPNIVRQVYNALIYREPEKYVFNNNNGCPIPQGLGLPVDIAFEQKKSVEGIINYSFESSIREEVASCSVTMEYVQRTNNIKRVVFRLYGKTRKAYIEMVTGITYDRNIAAMYSDSDKGLIDSYNESCFDLEEIPKRVAIQLDGHEVFCWVAKEQASMVLKEALGIKVCTARGILECFTEISRESGATVIRKKLVCGLLQTFEDKCKGQLAEVVEEGNEEYSEYPASLRKYARLINDADGNYKIEPALLAQVMRELIRWCCVKEKAEQYEEGSEEYMRELLKENLPNLVFLGEPGTGKTSLAKRLAENVLGAEFYCITGADLKGRYTGHTKSAVVENFIKLRERAGKDSKPAILFIDEAYNLFNNKDNLGTEVIEILLKAMEPRRRYLSAYRPKDVGEGERVEIWLNENTAVWLGGYEKDMRKALSVNRGMYRRVKTITLPIPEIDSLWEDFQRIMNQDNSLLDEEFQKANWELCEKKINNIHDYFTWARSKTYAEFFGNYSGVKRLAEEIVKSTLLKGKPLDELNHDLEDIIERQMEEIRTQYQQVIEEKYERLPFMVYTDIEDTFVNYIGADSAKEKLSHVIDMVCSPEKFPNCESPKGALLMGASGTGKTFLARCMAGELRKVVREKNLRKDVAFVKVTATELRTEELVKALFMASEGYDYVIIFIDEIDAIGRRREMLLNPSILIQLMNELDGFEGKKNVFVLAATNVPEILDAALKRPGRFDMNIEVGNPNDEDRRKLVQHYIGWKNCSNTIISEMVKHFRGYSPVQIKTILNETKILYHDCEHKIPASEAVKAWFAHREVRDNIKIKTDMKCITLKDGTRVLVSVKEWNESLLLMDFLEVLTRRTVGERTGLDKDSKEFSVEQNDTGLSATAIHEVGHALVSVMHGCNIEKITILERGDVLGYVAQDAEAKLRTKQDYLKRLDICFGGRAAEEIIYGAEQVSTDASRDIQTASRLARLMVMRLGMNEKVGPVALETPTGRYLGGNDQRPCTESTMTMAEDEVRKLLKERYSATLEMLRPHGELLKELAKYVFEKEEVSGEDFICLYKENKIC